MDSRSNLRNSSSRFGSHAYGVVSLTQLQISVSLRRKNRPFKNMLKRIDPNNDPSGNSFIIENMSNSYVQELKAVSIFVIR